MGFIEAYERLQQGRSVRLDLPICCVQIESQRLESEIVVTGKLRSDANVAMVKPAEDGDGDEFALA